MSAFTSIYSSLTGMLGFSSGLNTISDNVANLNTVGYRGSDVLFRDLGPRDPYSGKAADAADPFRIGEGVRVAGTIRSFKQGDFQSTNNASDLAIDGNGFFVLNRDGQRVYSRAGQFIFDSQGFLVDAATNARVQAMDGADHLVDVFVDRAQTRPPVATSKVDFGSVILNATEDTVTHLAVVTADNIRVFDPTGAARTVKLVLTKEPNSASGSVWDATVTEGTTQLGTGQLRYTAAGDVIAGFDQFTIVLPKPGEDSSVVFDLSDSKALATSSSTISPASVDGAPLGQLTQITIDGNGTLQLAFSNSSTVDGQTLALAEFANPQSLVPLDASQFTEAPDTRFTANRPTFGKASNGAFGTIQAGKVELSNVDLSAEFAKIIVLQRAFQGSSEILNISSQLLEALYNNVGGRSG